MLFSLLDPRGIAYRDLPFYTYAVVDGAKHKMLWSDLEDGVLEYEMLFRDALPRRELFTVAPYLIKLEYGEEKGREQSREIIDQCYGANSTLFFVTPLDFEGTLEKMRELFYLYDSEGEVGYLRFYDPLVFAGLAEERGETLISSTFSKIYTYWHEDPSDKSYLAQYLYRGETVLRLKVKVDAEAPYTSFLKERF